MIVDLVSPWLAAIEAADSPRARGVFRRRQAALLDALRRQRAPHSEMLPLEQDPERLRPLASRAASPDTQQLLRTALGRAAELGAGGCESIVLLAGAGTGDPVEPLPGPDGQVALFLDRAPDDRAMLAALGLGLAAVTRWSATDSRSPVRRLIEPPWNRWQAWRDLPLREWVYAAGLGMHLGHALLPGVPLHQLMGTSRAAFARLRQRETSLAALLAADLDQRGIGLILRWLSPAAPAGPRTVGGVILPPMAGHYLAWRLVTDRIARVGLAEAIRMAA